MNLVNVKVHAPTATILMDRGDHGNALDERLMEDLAQALDDLHQEKRVRAIILTGSGANFCTGMDLHELHGHSKRDPLDALPHWIEQWQRLAELTERFLRFPKPVIAAVDGQASGAGFSLALACDMIVASNNAQFTSTAIQRGMVAGVLAPLLTFRVGGAIAARLVMTGQVLTATEAARIGFVTRIASSDQIWVAANELAQTCAVWPASPMAATKRLLNESIGEAIFTHLAVGAATAATSCSTEVAAEGLAAFVEKRSASWPH